MRIELIDRETSQPCNITILYEFVESPAKGDYIVLHGSALTVSGRCHYLIDGKARLVILTSSYIVSKYDDMLMILDWFKDNYHIEHIESSSQPAKYYNLYRSIVNLLKWTNVSEKDFTDEITINKFVRSAVAVLMFRVGAGLELSYQQCKPWGDLLKLLILDKNKTADFRIVSIINEWNQKIKELAKIDDDWIVDASECVDNLAFINNKKSTG